MTDLNDAMRLMSRGQLHALVDHARGALTFASDDDGQLAVRATPRNRGWEALQHATMLAALDEIKERDEQGRDLLAQLDPLHEYRLPPGVQRPADETWADAVDPDWHLREPDDQEPDDAP